MAEEESVALEHSVTAGAVDLSALSWAEDAVGAPLVSYVFGCALDELPLLISGERPLDEGQSQVARDLYAVREQIPSAFGGNIPSRDALSFILSSMHASGKEVVARMLRSHSPAIDGVSESVDDLERAIIWLALDVYPTLLLPPDPEFPPMWPGKMNSRASILLLHAHPAAKLFSEAVLEDVVLKELFSLGNEHSGRTVMVSRSTGTSSGVQLELLPSIILENVWRNMQGDGVNPDLFVQKVAEELAIVRHVLAGKRHKITARMAFAGVLMPPGTQFDVDGGVVRVATEADRRLVPEQLKGQLAGTDQAGVTTTINYDGDIILEYKHAYKTKITPGITNEPPMWPSDVIYPPELERTVLRLRFGLMLAIEREQRVQLVQTWRSFDDPLATGYSVSWNDPRRGVGIMPCALTEEEVVDWRKWYALLGRKSVSKIEVALTRILRAIAERHEPSDVLIDSVIAWENLFGTKDGEPTFRVTMCIAKLLEESDGDRLKLKSRLGKIYTLRSDVVHGSRSISVDDYPLCREALEVAIRVVKLLVSDRSDILDLPDGATRSAALLIHG